MFVFPFYAYKALSFASNSDVSVVPQIMDQLYGKGGPGNPLKHILETFIFLGKKTYGIFPLFFFLIPFSLKDKKYRHLAYLILLPYFFIWLFFAGYDARNLSLILPILSIGACIGIEAIVAAQGTRIARILNRTNVFAVGAGFIALLCLTSGITSKKILEGKRLAERELYDKEASLRISEYFESASGGEKIYTNFPVLQWMPATKDRLYRPYGEDFFGDDFKGYGKETEKPSRFSYILAAPYTDQKIKDDIQAKIEAKQYTLIFQLRGYVLVKREK
jgi:hypothetical protein